MTAAFKEIYSPIFQPELLQAILYSGTFCELQPGQALLKYGDYVRAIPLIIKGSLKIVRQDEKGNEILLYFIQKGETCALTLSYCLGHQKSKITALSETPVQLISIPIQKMEEWSSRHKSWRIFVFKNYDRQLQSAFQAIDRIAFQKLDKRLVNYLRNKQQINGSKTLKTTHQEIADDLNSSRVVISRLLKKLEHSQKIMLYHQCIQIINLSSSI